MRFSSSNNAEKGSMLIPAIIAICIVLIIVGYFVVSNILAKNATSAQTASYVTPTPNATDFAPELPMDKKTKLLIRQSDSSTTTFIVPTDQVDTYVKKLPAGDTIVSKSP